MSAPLQTQVNQIMSIVGDMNIVLRKLKNPTVTKSKKEKLKLLMNSFFQIFK